jgi:hypothetical protein
MPRGGYRSEGSVKSDIQVTCPGFDDGRLLGSLKQRADLGAPSVDRDDEKTALARAEELTDLAELIAGGHLPKVSGDASRARKTAGGRDRGID